MSESKPTTPVALRVDTTFTSHPHGSSAKTPISATSATIQIPLTPSEVQTPPSPRLAKLASVQNTSHAKDESRKLLALLVDQLLGRPKPPCVFELSGITGKSNGRRRDSLLYSSLPTNDDSDEEVDSWDGFSTDFTFDLMPLSVYHLSAFSSPLLAAVLETVDARASSPLAMYNFHRLVDTLVTEKKDSYLDILQIVAYHTSGSRRSALSLLTTFWPAAVGHTVVSKALPVFSYAEMLAKEDTLLCASCKLFAHFSCVSSVASQHPHCGSINLDSTHMTVSLSRLRQSFADFYGDIFLSSDDLGKRTYEEISVSSSVLWTQLQIYYNGLTLGSFSVSKEDTNAGDGDFELPFLVELYEAYLSSGKLPVSTSLAEYIQTNSQQQAPHLIMFDWSILAYIASTVKAPCDTQDNSFGVATGFLRVDGVEDHADDDGVPRHPYEMVPLSHVYDALGYEFNVVSEGPAYHLLSHLHKLGFLCSFPSADTECYFPLPLGFDLSLAAIESCLSDLDLSVNESGLLLLVRRFWPNGLMSEYALRRLTRTLVGWILSEDNCLATILRDYVSEGRRLPGVRAPTDPVPWPRTQNSRRIPTNSVNNGGDYIASRRNLLHTYIAKWLLALHNQDISAYPAIVFDATHEIASDCTYDADDTLLDCQDQSMPILQRLFNIENDSAARFSTYVDATLTNFDEKGLKMADLWGAVWRFTERTGGFTSGLMWLRLFARSGVDIDTSTITKYSSIIFSRNPSLDQASIFMDAVLITTWLRSVGRQDLQPVVGKTMRFFRHAIKRSSAIAFVRRALTTCLLLYGCDRRLLLTLEMADQAEVHQLPVRRKPGVRQDKPTDPIIIDRDLMLTLDEYFRYNNEEIVGLAAKFLHSFMLNSPYLEAFEVDNFVLRNAKTLCTWVWQLYDNQQLNISTIRTALLLRILVVDVVPFRELLTETFSSSSPWETRLITNFLIIRLVGASRLFRIIMDVKNPAFQVKDCPWKICVLDIFYFFFQLIWLDKKEEIRAAVETWSQTLLTPQLEVIASCWSTALLVLKPPERLQLVVFLTQLQPHFPAWKILSWDAIIEALQGDDQTGKKVALILLSLQMMESGMEVDIFSSLNLKYHLAKVVGFSDVEATPTATGRSFFVRFEKLESIPPTAFPCVQALPRILDAHRNFELPPTVMGSTLVEDDKPCRALIGTIFVDLVLAIFCSSHDLLTLPILTLKSLLEALVIITFKHDFGSMAIRHLDVSLRKALRKTSDFLLLDVSYELRQLALSVIQTYIKRGAAITGVLAVECMDKAAALIVTLKHNDEDVLVSQAKAFIESTLNRLVSSGVYCSLCKRPPNPDFYEVLKTIIQARDGRATEASINFQEDLLHSIISQPPEVDWKISHNTVKNINMFVEIVCDGVSDKTMKDLAAWIVATARRAAVLRTTVRKETILLLRTAASSQGDASSSGITVLTAQTFYRTMVEIVDDILRLKVRANPTTSVSLIEVLWLIRTDDATPKLARSAIHFLQNYNWTTGEVDADLTLSLTVGRYIFYAAERGYDVLDELNDDNNLQVRFTTHATFAADDLPQRSFPSDITIRPWIIMLLTAVSNPSFEKYGALMMSRFDNFVTPYTKTLGTYIQGGLPPPETAAADIEYAYLAMKSWMLLLYKLSTGKIVDPSGELACKLWNELWPPFESLVKLLGQESSDELLPLSTAVSSSAANLFIFLLQSRSPIAMDCIPCLTLLKHLRQLGGRNSALSKLARALDGDVLPELRLDAIIAQMTKDTTNADKLRRLDRHTKATVDRRRVPTPRKNRYPRAPQRG
ncbi:hypothetical protein EDD15DRAFT_2384583 [Pisolithus albus]|nr:hypothetical protein EDD15DRAFT_2384583 [Pisolithus albus]